MHIITNFLRGVFYFFVGDWIILIGVALTLLVVSLVEILAPLSGLKDVAGYIFFAGIVLTLVLTLRREIYP